MKKGHILLPGIRMAALRRARHSVLKCSPVAMAFLLLSVVFGVSAAVDLAYEADVTLWFLLASAVCAAIGTLPFQHDKNQQNKSSAPRLVNAAFSVWVIVAMGGAVAHLLAGATRQVDVAIFEGTAAATTTSMTLLDPSELPHGLLLFRALTQWFSGAGGLIFALVLLPFLFNERENVETYTSTRHYLPSLMAQTKGIYKALTIYLVFSFLIFCGYAATGMNVFEGIAHAMTTISTGGLSTRSGSIGAFNNAGAEWVATVAMGLAGLNVGVVWWAARGNRRSTLKLTELRSYLIVMGVSAGAISLWLLSSMSGAEAFRSGAFAVTSAMSTTGFESIDNRMLNSASQALLLLLIAVGAMSASPGGGLGYRRVLQLAGLVRSELVRRLHPSSVAVVRVNNRVCSEQAINRLSAHVALLFLTAVAGALLIGVGDSAIAPQSAIAISITALSTAGQQSVEPISLDAMSGLSKSTVAVLMLIGRVSIFAAIVVGGNMISRALRHLPKIRG